MLYIIFAILLLVAIFVIVLAIGKLIKNIPYFGAEKEVDIEKIIEKVKKEYPDYTIFKIFKYNGSIRITFGDEYGVPMKGMGYLEYSKGRLKAHGTSFPMEDKDIEFWNRCEIIYDA